MQKRFGDRLSPAAKYWIFLISIITTIFAVVFGSFAASYLNLDAADQVLARDLFEKLIPFPFVGSLILVVFICSMVSLLFQFYIIPVLRMAEQTRLITAANPEHRITTRGARELMILAEVINESADAFQELQNSIDRKVHQANLALKLERNRFAALMSELPNGVVVCNSDGLIMLYNPKAQEMLQVDSTKPEQTAAIGLGRSIFGILDREPLAHTLEVMNHAFGLGQVKPMLGLMTKLCGNHFIRVNMAPVINREEEPSSISGFILTLEDITNEVQASSERDLQLQGLIDAVQKSLGNIHRGIATICDMPGVGNEVCNRHRQTIEQVSSELEEHLALARNLYSAHLRAYGKRENVLTDTLLAIMAKSIKERFGMQVTLNTTLPIWLKIDSYAIVQAVTNLAGLLHAEQGIQQVSLQFHRAGERLAGLTFAWPGQAVPLQTIVDWLESPLFKDITGKEDTPKTIISDHNGSITPKEATGDFYQHVIITLPTALTGETTELQTTIKPRPVAYEFDLFHQPGQEVLGQVPLRKLTYVAFDTETTGLNPSKGDEIIQIGAVRIVNNRLLKNEVIDQLVNPQRPVPPASTRIHGIQPELLADAPQISDVLSRFHAFAEGAVLVAHNAAFDMRFLQLKEEETGLRFENPVLDTLLLSSLVHPNQEDHSLEAIAERFNIEVIGRHTAFGDALVTAEVLLKLRPLLEAQGILTLADALLASATSPFAQLKY